MSTPIYDQPNHPNYGPVRRMHLMLMQLSADFRGGFGEFERQFTDMFSKDWTRWLNSYLEIYTESRASVLLMRDALKILD